MPRVSDFERFVFVVGAPRCGTTTLAYFLKNNAAVNFPSVKEPHYFAQHDLRGLPQAELHDRVESEFLNRFFGRESKSTVGADASVTYLYTPEQLEPILRLWPNSRFIVSLRDPMSMLPSLHQRLNYNGDETITDFAQAWAASSDRAAGRKIPNRCADPRWLRYDEAGRYCTYLERLFAVVGRERCLVVTLDDIAASPGALYSRFMKWVQLEPKPDADLKPQRAAYRVRYPALQRLLKRPPAKLMHYLAGQHYYQRVQDLNNAKKYGRQKAIWNLRKRLLRWNRVRLDPQQIPIEVQWEIARHYRHEIDQLAMLLGRDLSHWLQPVLDSRDQGAAAVIRA